MSINIVILSGVVSNVKLFNGGCFARLQQTKTYKGETYKTSQSITAFKECADKLAKLDGKYVVVNGYLKNSKLEEGYKLEVICNSLDCASDATQAVAAQKEEDEIAF